jgi:hypothetical protein
MTRYHQISAEIMVKIIEYSSLQMLLFMKVNVLKVVSFEELEVEYLYQD